MAPKPLLTYFTPQVLRPLLKTKLRMLRMKIAFHCFPFGQDAFLYTKKSNEKHSCNKLSNAGKLQSRPCVLLLLLKLSRWCPKKN